MLRDLKHDCYSYNSKSPEEEGNLIMCLVKTMRLYTTSRAAMLVVLRWVEKEGVGALR